MPQEKLPKQELLARANGKKPVDDLELDESILHSGSWVEILGNSPESNNGDD